MLGEGCFKKKVSREACTLLKVVYNISLSVESATLPLKLWSKGGVSRKEVCLLVRNTLLISPVDDGGVPAREPK